MHKIILHRNTVKFYRKADDAHRFRIGDLHILYEIDGTQEIVWIKTIEWRGSASNKTEGGI
jgi:mRNA-degrading endonuclease RelE of RelBE toxin-antitoxin system